MRQKRLAQFLDENSWSQADLAREAGISAGSISRALNGDTITRRSANAIVDALDRAQQAKSTQLRAAHVTLASVRGLHISQLQRKKKSHRRHLIGGEAAADPEQQNQ